jgi:uncharacterized protein YllA (UPF0747 family)
MNSSLEKALEGTWKNKEKFYEETKHMNIMEIIEKIEGKKFNIKKNKKELLKNI